MPRLTSLLLALTLTTITSAAFAQNSDQQSDQMSNPPMRAQPAPIQRATEAPPDNSNDYNTSP
jgi:hypothetical protein